MLRVYVCLCAFMALPLKFRERLYVCSFLWLGIFFKILFLVLELIFQIINKTLVWT